MINFKKIKEVSHIKMDPRFEKLPLKYLFVISFFINLIFILFGLASTFILPPEIPLFYGLPKNSAQLAKSLYIIIPAAVSMVITIVNAVISINIESQYLKRAMAFASLSVTILSVIATYKIIFLVGSL